MTYLEEYLPALVAEILDLAARLDDLPPVAWLNAWFDPMIRFALRHSRGLLMLTGAIWLYRQLP